MPKTSDGKVLKVKSETALLAFICIKLGAIPEKAQTNHLKKRLKVNMSGAVARQVGARRSWVPPKGVARGKRPARRDQALRSWLLVDEERLGYKRALVTFPGDGARQVDLIASLRRTVGVRQVIETRERRDVHAIVLFTPEEEDQLLAKLEGLGRCLWNGISDEDHLPALHTWETLLKRKARREGLGL
ncbi:MAG: hypothetical protein M3335_05155 [Actinomycetota bacterium]|nr:hypothetical protein [Actinomycetota bacterium]